MSENLEILNFMDYKVGLIIIIEALSQLGWGQLYEFCSSILMPWAKSLGRLYLFVSILTISIRVPFGLPLFLNGPSTCIEKF